MSLIWEATHAGTCYPSKPGAIRNYFRQALERESPGLPMPLAPWAWIVPHIDFRVDISTYADVYRHIARRKAFPETVFILGVGHRCPHDFSLCSGTFLTPLGEVPPASAPISEISQSSGLKLDRSPETFTGEHSLEFAVIWLQALRDLHFPGQPFAVVPVLLGGLPEHVLAGHPPGPRTAFHRFGKSLMAAYRKREASSLLLASIDGCHVGPRFGHDFPADERIQQTVWNWEAKLWKNCTSGTLPVYFQQLGEIRNGFYFDGVGVLTLLLQQRQATATVLSRKIWHDPRDQSLVTFTAGCLEG